MHTGQVALLSSLHCLSLSHLASQPLRQVGRPLLPPLVLSAHTNATGSLWDMRVTLRNETVLKERREFQHFQTL